jgi:hypothetical protein
MQTIELGPNGLWRIEEALETSKVLSQAGEKMSAHNQRWARNHKNSMCTYI